jgi:type I restriction enzyme S subunit
MIEGIKPYKDYKETGQGWIGAVPAHWEIRPAFGVYQENHDKNKGLIEKTVLSLSYGRIIIKPTEKLRGLVPESFETYQIVNPGDIVIRTTDLQNDHTSLRTGFVRDRGIITSAYLALKVKKGIQPEFGCQILNVWDLSKAIYGYGSGLRQNLSFGHFKRMLVAVPPREEQDTIVKFLDYTNWRIDRAIKSKRKTIALLNEQKQVIIHHVVTRGLNTSAPLKPSGISWLGEIPKHWDVLRARFLFRAVTRRDTRPDDPKLSVTQSKGVIPTNEMRESSTQARNYDRFQVCHQGDLVLNKYKAHLGVFCCANQRGLITPNYTVFRSIRELETKYFDLLFHTRAYCDAFYMQVYGVTEGMSPLYTQDFYRTPILFPPVEEQQKIVEEVATLTKKENLTIDRLEREIKLLQEYRIRMISDVVTGKLDVREAAKNLPAEIIAEPSDDMSDGENEEEIEEAA